MTITKKILFLLLALYLAGCGYQEESNPFSGSGPAPDVTAPGVTNVEPSSGSKVDYRFGLLVFSFSETVTGADTTGNYVFSGSGAGTLAVSSISNEGDSYFLVLSGSPADGAVSLTLTNIADSAGNSLSNNTFSYTGWWNTNWQARRRLTFDNSGQAQTLTNFPVLVKLNSAVIDYATTQNSGQDIRFLSPSWTILNHDIESWNESGNSIVWVLSPEIEGSSATNFIWMYYGNSTTNDSQDKANVWAADYMAVYHMQETGTADHTNTLGTYLGTRAGNTYTASGQIGGAQVFSGANTYITPGDIDPLDSIGVFTFSVWFNRNTDRNDASNHAVDNVLFAQSSGGANDNMEIGTDGTFVEIYADTISSDATVSFDAGIADSTWYNLVITYDKNDANELKLYLNGNYLTQWASFGGDFDASATSPIGIGIARPTDNRWGDFDGIIDEVRVSTVARSSDWIKAQYISMTNGFVTFGAEE